MKFPRLKRATPPVPARETWWARLTARQRWDEDRLFREWDEFTAQMRDETPEKESE